MGISLHGFSLHSVCCGPGFGSMIHIPSPVTQCLWRTTKTVCVSDKWCFGRCTKLQGYLACEWRSSRKSLKIQMEIQHVSITLCLLTIAMENGPFIDHSWWLIYLLTMNMFHTLNCQRYVSTSCNHGPSPTPLPMQHGCASPKPISGMGQQVATVMVP